MGSSVKLTDEVLKTLIREMLHEHSHASHCQNKPTTDRLECESKDQEGRDKATQKRKNKEMVWPGYYDRNGSLDRLSRGIIEDATDQDPVVSLKTKLRGFLATLTPDEKKILSRATRKPTLADRLKFCGTAKDMVDGRWNDEELKRQQFISKQQNK